jgi:cytochrome bd-type quinol oxidase subunit 1
MPGHACAQACAHAYAYADLSQLPRIVFPVIGNKWIVGSLFLAHILLGSFSMGAVLIAPAAELAGRWRRDPRLERYAHAVATTNLKVFSLGATLGAFAVFLLSGLYPNLLVSLGVLFFKTLLIAFTSWFLTIALLLVYAYKWKEVIAVAGRGTHLVIGFAGGLSEQLFLFLIVGVDSFMLTPNQGQDFGAIFNPSFWPELGHRFTGNLSWSALLIAAVMVAWWATHRDAEDRAYYAWAARVSLLLGFLLLVPQAIGGFAFAESIRHAEPAAFGSSFRGPTAWMWQVQQALFGLLLIGGNVYFWRTREPRGALSAALTAAVLALSIGMVLPAAAYPGPSFWLRYLWLTLALLLSVAHWLLWKPWRRAGRPDPGGLGRWAVAGTGIVAVVLFLLMGVIRETARDPYAVYGRMTQTQAEGLFQPPSDRFYP